MAINVKSITAWILYFNNRISSFLSFFFFSQRALTHTASPAESPFIFALEGCITVRDSSYFLWLLFTLSTSHGQHYVPHERWFRNIHKDEGPVRDEVGSFTVSAPFEVLVYEGGGGWGGSCGLHAEASDMCRTDCSDGRNSVSFTTLPQVCHLAFLFLCQAFVTLMPQQM